MSTRELDYPTPDLGYYEAALRRLDYRFSERNVPSTDEAVRVISPEEWSLANQARAAAEERQQELQEMQEHLRDVEGREGALNRQVQELRDQLDEAKRRREELIPLEFVGVRGVLAPEERKRRQELMEFEEEPVEEPVWAEAPAAPPAYAGPESMAWEETGQAPVPPIRASEDEWEPVADEEAWPAAEPEAEQHGEWAVAEEPDAWQETDEEPAWEPEPEAEEPEPGWEVAPAEPRVQPPLPDQDKEAVEHEIRQIEDEIRKIEEELALIAAQERELESRGAQPTAESGAEDAAYRTGDYTLFVKQVENPDGTTRPFYFFSKETARDDADPSALPDRYDVAINARTTMPYLKRKSDEGV
jgi:hypothetical protein